MAALGGIEPDPDDLVAMRKGGIEGALRVVLVEMAQEAHDQACADAELAPRPGDRARKAVHHGREGDAARRVALRIEEHLDMAHIVGLRALEIRPGEIEEVLLGDEHRHALVVDVEKVLQLRELIGAAQRLDRRERQRDAVAPREREHQLGLEAALDVDVQLAFRQAADEFFLRHD